MTPSADELLQVLGKPHVDSTLSELLVRLGLANKKFRVKRGESDIAFDVPDHGVDLIFSDPHGYANKSQIPEGALMLTCVFFFSEGREGHRTFPNPLPAGLSFQMSRDAVRQKFGHPEFSSPILPVDRWLWGGIKLGVTFSDDSSSVVRVGCTFPKITGPA
jgi:hypothetical protein